jgi:hypothetical protein
VGNFARRTFRIKSRELIREARCDGFALRSGVIGGRSHRSSTLDAFVAHRHQLIAHIGPYLYTAGMGERLRKITVNVPAEVLENATRATGKGVTLTVIEGLRELERGARRSALRALRGKVRLELDLEETRR